jgi:hypothetical protein
MTPWSRDPLVKQIVTQLVRKFPIFRGIRKFIAVFTRVCHFSLSWARWIQSTNSQPISLRPIPTLSSHQRLGLPSGLFLSDFPTKILYELPASPMCVTWPPSHSPWFDHSSKVNRKIAQDAFLFRNIFFK